MRNVLKHAALAATLAAGLAGCGEATSAQFSEMPGIEVQQPNPQQYENEGDDTNSVVLNLGPTTRVNSEALKRLKHGQDYISAVVVPACFDTEGGLDVDVTPAMDQVLDALPKTGVGISVASSTCENQAAQKAGLEDAYKNPRSAAAKIIASAKLVGRHVFNVDLNLAAAELPNTSAVRGLLDAVDTKFPDVLDPQSMRYNELSVTLPPNPKLPTGYYAMLGRHVDGVTLSSNGRNFWKSKTPADTDTLLDGAAKEFKEKMYETKTGAGRHGGGVGVAVATEAACQDKWGNEPMLTDDEQTVANENPSGHTTHGGQLVKCLTVPGIDAGLGDNVYTWSTFNIQDAAQFVDLQRQTANS